MSSAKAGLVRAPGRFFRIQLTDSTPEQPVIMVRFRFGLQLDRTEHEHVHAARPEPVPRLRVAALVEARQDLGSVGFHYDHGLPQFCFH
jgi:hypothetical protein